MYKSHAKQAKNTLSKYSDLEGVVLTSEAWDSVENFVLKGNERPDFLLVEEAFLDLDDTLVNNKKLRRCAAFFGEISSTKPRPRPSTSEAIGMISTGHAKAVRTGIGDYYLGVIQTTGTPELTVFEEDPVGGRVKVFDISTGHDAFTPKNVMRPDLIELHEGQLIILRGNATFAEIDGDHRFRKSTVPHALDISQHGQITAMTSHAVMSETDVWLPHADAAGIPRFTK